MPSQPRSRADDWPQWLGPQRDGVWRESGLLTKFPKGGPTIKWRAPIGGGYAGPAVSHGKVYVADHFWAPGAKEPANLFDRKPVPGFERVVCLDEATGKPIWEHKYATDYAISYAMGPRATPVIADGKVYALGAMGDLFCLDADSGKVNWSRNFPKDFGAKVPLWGFAAHPLLDGDSLICLVGASDGVAVAFDKATGKEKWRSLALKNPTSEIGYAPPMVYKVGAKREVIIWDTETVNGLDPETGKPLWSFDFPLKANLAVSTPRLIDDQLFLTSFYNGSRLLKLKPESATLLWGSKRIGESPGQTEILNSIMPTPYIVDGHIYGICSYGELRCIRLSDGKRVWSDLRAASDAAEPEEVRWANAFLTPNGDRWFLFNEKGQLIIAKLTPKGYDEIDRAKILEPTSRTDGRRVLWSHPAFANKCMFARNDKEIVCVSLAGE